MARRLLAHWARTWVATLLVLVLGSVLVAGSALAAPPREHRVGKGQTLGKIAKRYNVTIDALCRANDITPKTRIKPGQKLLIPPKDDANGDKTRELLEKRGAESTGDGAQPIKGATKGGEAPVWHVVAKGQRLGTIARRYGTTVDAIRHANALDPKDPIKPRQKLIIPAPNDETGERARAVREAQPDAPPVAPSAAPVSKGPSWSAHAQRPTRPGYLTILGRQKSWKGYAVGKSGRALKRARHALKEVLATSDGTEHDIDPRLIEMLVKVSDTFGGRPIRIVSGFRLGETSRTSRHRHGKAVDFQIPGVPNAAVRDFAKTLDKVGVGYYPNSSFVHLDVRDQWTYWIDYSGPGQRARYGGVWTRRSK